MKKKKVQKRNPNKTRERIFNCAFKMFAKHGYYGTTLDEILKKAKVNKRMVYHYFGSKEGLYREIHMQGWKKLQEEFAKYLTDPGYAHPEAFSNPTEIFLGAIRLHHRFVGEHLEFQRLVIWDALEGGKVTRSLWKEVREPLFRHVLDFISILQEQGFISGEVKAIHLLLSILGMVCFYFIFENSLEEMLGAKPLSPSAIQEREEQLIALCRHLLLAKEPPPTG